MFRHPRLIEVVHPNLVERFFNRIKQFRRIATRYEKLARNFFSMLTECALLKMPLLFPLAPVISC